MKLSFLFLGNSRSGVLKIKMEELWFFNDLIVNKSFVWMIENRLIFNYLFGEEDNN